MRLLTYWLQRLVRKLVPAIAYRDPPRSGLTPDRLYAWLDTVWQRRCLDGTILEVGCDECGTSYLTLQFLRRSGCPKPYVCGDTFSGFVHDQFEHEARMGLDRRYRLTFANSTLSFVRNLLAKYGADEINLVQGDIVTLDKDLLPGRIAACLLDVDLEIPIYEGLKKVFPRLLPGAAILVDDCEEDSVWGARKGYTRFLQETGLPQKTFMGMGLIEKP